MNSIQQKIIDGVVAVEAGYVDNPADSGGPTKWGITERVARRFGYEGHMRDLPRSVACDIYFERYWNELNGDALVEISELVAYEVFDTGVNLGVRRATTFLQRALNIFNQEEDLYGDIVVDGHLGFLTLEALRFYMDSNRKEAVLVKVLDCLQGAWYIQISEDYLKNETFAYGWFNQRVAL